MKKKLQGSFNRVTFILLLLGVLILVNLISINFFTRFDLTEGRIYTLADASKDAVANLQDRLTVKAFFTKDLPPPYSSLARYLKDQLEEYRAHSNGKFYFEFVDPTEENELASEAQSYQVAPVQLQVVESDKIELKKVYMGLVFLYGDKHETIPVIQSTAGLEYDITSTIKKIIADRVLRIGFLTGHGEAETSSEMTALAGSLQKNYEVAPVTIEEGKLVPDNIDVLLIIRPKAEFSEWDQFAIDQFIMHGGRTAFLMNKIEANLQEARANRIAGLNLDELTKSYGFRITDDLVYDQKCGMITIRQGGGFFTIQNSIPYPFFPNIRNFDEENAMVKNMEELMLYFPSSIEPVKFENDSVEASHSFTPLAWTSKKSGRMIGRFEINPTVGSFKNMNFPDSALVVAATLVGSFKSYFTDKDIPLTESGAPYTGDFLPASQATRIVVIGDGNFPTDQYLTSRSSADFFLNMVDWLAQDESLIHIRTREITSRPLADVSEPMKRFIKYLNILLPSILVIIFGIVRWQMRKKQKPVL